MLNKKMIDFLNNQIELEAIASQVYLAMASLLVICAAVSLFNNYKKYKKVVFIYLIIVNVLLEALFIGKLLI